MGTHGAGIVSLKSFGLGLGLCLIGPPRIAGWIGESLMYGIIGLVTILVISKNDVPQPSTSQMSYFQIRIRAFFLGWGLSCGIRIILSGFSIPFGVYVSLLSVFHYSEFLVTSITSPETLCLDSFLLNHSKEYGIAALGSVMEFFTEFYFISWLKNLQWITLVGVVLCVGGELIRKCSMLTASKNFTHLIRERKVEGQYLVTTGPYAICRHPGYAGWFWWSIGTQVVLINPICLIGYFFAVLSFFKSRIYHEEIFLVSFFGLDYVEYQKKVPQSGVPFVKGYMVTDDEPEVEESMAEDENDSDE